MPGQVTITNEVKDLRREAGAPKECVADLTVENPCSKSMIADRDDAA